MSHVLDGGEIGWRVIGSDPALVVTEDHVHDPMKAVLNCPVAAHDWPEESRHHDHRGDIKPCLLLGFSADLAAAFDHHDSVQTRPVVALLQPFDVGDDGGGSGLDAAMVAIDRRIPTDL